MHLKVLRQSLETECHINRQAEVSIQSVSEVSQATSQFPTCKYSAVVTVCTNSGLFGQAARL